MLDVEQHHPPKHQPHLARWLHQLLQESGVHLRVRLRGNNLHILCEAGATPSKAKIAPRLVAALKSEAGKQRLLSWAGEHPIHRLILYGRAQGQERPEWIEKITLNLSSSESRDWQENVDGKQTISATNSADLKTSKKQSNLGEIARHLSASLSHLGVSIRLKRQKLGTKSKVTSKKAKVIPSQRLWVICDCNYSPDASVLAEPIAQKLRQLKLEGFREAIIRSQVVGEKEPDWSLRVDLTPPGQMLKDWAYWGDVQAIANLLNQELNSQGVTLQATLKDTTLHLFCRFLATGESEANSESVPNQQEIIPQISNLLQSLTPQGITAAVVYGITSGFQVENLVTNASESQESNDKSPAWVQWLQLNPEAEISTFTLAQKGNQDALKFLLERLLNRDLDWRLATGGIRIKLCRKQDLLHIMTEAVVCPEKVQILEPTESLLRQLSLSKIAGVRIYGRRAGQINPLWNYGVDFVNRQRSSGSKRSSALATISSSSQNATETDHSATSVAESESESLMPIWGRFWQTITATVTLGGTQILVPNLESPGEEKLANTLEQNLPAGLVSRNLASYQGTKVALVWGFVGLFLTLQANWLLGRLLIVNQQSPQESLVISESNWDILSWQKSQPAEAVSGGDFIKPGSLTTQDLAEGRDSLAQLAILAAARSTNPSFNNRVLNEKLALYQQRVAESGVPDVLIVGSSRAMRGIDPKTLNQALQARGHRQLEVFNFGINGATAQVVDLMLREILTPEQLPKMIIWADGARAFNSGRVDHTYNAIASSEGFQSLLEDTFPQQQHQPGTVAKGNLKDYYRQVENWLNQGTSFISPAYSQRQQLKNKLRNHFAAKVDSVVAPLVPNRDPQPAITPGETLAIDRDGFLPINQKFNPQTYYESHPRVAGLYDGDYNTFYLEGKQHRAMLNLLSLLEKHQIELVFVNTPLTDDYLDSTRSQYEQEFQQYMNRVAIEHNFAFIDLGQKWLTEYNFFSDPSHLNRYGAVQLSVILSQEAVIFWPRQ